MRTVVVLVSAFLRVVVLSLSRFPVFWKGHVIGPIESFEEMGEDGDWPSLEKGGSADGECDGETFVTKFRLFIQSPLGGNRNDTAARQIERNVQKYLKRLSMNPRRLLDINAVHRSLSNFRTRVLVAVASFQPFIEQLQDEGIGCSGILQQLDAHFLAQKFLNFSDEEEGLSGKVQRALDFLRSYCRGFTAQLQKRVRALRLRPMTHQTSPELIDSRCSYD